jgi:hypothetical protein
MLQRIIVITDTSIDTRPSASASEFQALSLRAKRALVRAQCSEFDSHSVGRRSRSRITITIVIRVRAIRSRRERARERERERERERKRERDRKEKQAIVIADAPGIANPALRLARATTGFRLNFNASIPYYSSCSCRPWQFTRGSLRIERR